jgi:hypothetical protein
MTGEYASWFQGLRDDAREAVLRCAYLLEHEGPLLGRPHADTVKGSTIVNLKELRPVCHGHIYRILYRFDEKREALLLVGDDKKGRDDRQFYHHLIRRAEAIIKDLSEGLS